MFRERVGRGARGGGRTVERHCYSDGYYTDTDPDYGAFNGTSPCWRENTKVQTIIPPFIIHLPASHHQRQLFDTETPQQPRSRSGEGSEEQVGGSGGAVSIPPVISRTYTDIGSRHYQRRSHTRTTDSALPSPPAHPSTAPRLPLSHACHTEPIQLQSTLHPRSDLTLT